MINFLKYLWEQFNKWNTVPLPPVPPKPPVPPLTPPPPVVIPPMPPPVKTNREKLHEEALKWIGKDASPYNSAPQDLACAESVSTIVRRVVPTFPIVLGTADLLGRLKNDKRFKGTLDPKPGNIILSATGSGNGSIRGHTGIFTIKEQIMANNSYTGLWGIHWDSVKWKDYYRIKGGMPTHYFELL